MRRKLLAIFGALLVGGYLAAGYVRSNQWIGSHPQWRTLKATPSEYGLRAEVVSFRSEDGIELKAWWLPGQNGNEVRPGTGTTRRPNVILAHGREDNRSGMLPRAKFLVGAGFNVLDVDLRNHGESGGNYVTPGYLEALDLLGAVDYLRTRGERAAIGVLGFSYGAVAGLHAAARSNEIRAVVADSAFLSNADLRSRVARSSAVSWTSKVRAWLGRLPLLDPISDLIFRLRTGINISGDEKDSLTAIDGMQSRPIFFISGERDWIAPPENARRMYQQARSPRKELMIVPGAGHNETHSAGPAEYEWRVVDFFAANLKE